MQVTFKTFLLLLQACCEGLPEGSWPSTHPVPGRSGWSSSVGNHRWVIVVDKLPGAGGGAVRARVPWRRRDSLPLAKDSFIISAVSHLRVARCGRIEADLHGEAATYVFDASDGPGEYHLYFMPFLACEYGGGSCPYDATVEYISNASMGCADGRWWAEQDPVSASSVELQSRTAFDAFQNEEIAATAEERIRLAAQAPATSPVVVVTEDRSHPLRMRRQVPYSWVQREQPADFFGSAQPGEQFTLQLGVWAHKRTVQLKNVSFTSLAHQGGDASIPSSQMRCMNIAGTDHWGRPYHSSPSVLAGHVLPLWVAVRVPIAAPLGEYKGSAILYFDNGESHVRLTLHLSGPPLSDGGDSEAWRGTRLQWLDSDLALAGDSVPPPYLPLLVTHESSDGLVVTMLDKKVRIGPDGLPWEVTVGTAAATSPEANAVEAEALVSPVALTIFSAGVVSHLAPLELSRGAASNMSVSWLARLGTLGGIQVNVSGSLDCTGYLDYRLDFSGMPSGSKVELVTPARGLMAMGLGLEGDYLSDMRPATGRSEWLVLDMGRLVTADAFGIYSAGDSVHDPQRMRLQVADTSSGPWQPIAAFMGRPGVVGRQMLPFGDQLRVTSRFWRWVIDGVVPSSLCAPLLCCQAWIAEVELRDSVHGWIQNSGTAERSIVVASSGGLGGMAAWMAADGVLTFVEGRRGWDAADLPLPDVGGEVQVSENLVYDWKWDGVNGNNAVWVGTSAAGLRLFPKGADDLWQAAVPFDSKQSPVPPAEWNNDQKGGIMLFRNGTIIAYTGPSEVADRTLRFSLMATPVRPLNLPKHYKERYAQLGGAANYSFLAEQGATVVNMHQGNPINPWINYPYNTNMLMRRAADACHAVGMRFKIYNTMRELSNRCREIWAMLAFNETYVCSSGAELTDVGRGADWLQEHVQYGYETAWSNPVENGYPGSGEKSVRVVEWSDHPLEQDSAIKVRALSRWNNYYIEGLRQMIADFGFDGLYLDEIAYDRITMFRAKKVLGAGRLVDHHSDQNGFTPSPTMNYLELFPFIDSLWYGEGFNYEAASPAFWLTEMSGLPHGLLSDMLRYEGMTPQHFKGMLFASANRWQCGLDGPVGSCPFDPRDVWKLWDDFGIEQATMWGWWLDRERGNGTLPITLSSDKVKVTSFVRRGLATLLAIGSWLRHDANVTLMIDWVKVGLEAGACVLDAPRLVPMQPTAKRLAVSDPLLVPAGQGLLLVLRRARPEEEMYV